MLPKIRELTVGAVLLVVCTLPARAAMHATAEFEQGDTRPRSIAFLPPHATLIKRKVVRTEEQIEESIEFSRYLAASVQGAFEAQGYEVKVITPDEISADPGLQEMVLDADRRYAEMLTQVRMKLPRQIGKRRYAAGDEMRTLAAKLGVDAIGFADLQMVSAAAGASAVAILVGFGAAGTSTMLSVSVIDGATANIEAYFVPPVMRRGSIAGYDAIMADPAGKIREIADLTLRELPPANAVARATSPESEDEVLKDVESLLERP
jgi:hypothetical protein